MSNQKTSHAAGTECEENLQVIVEKSFTQNFRYGTKLNFRVSLEIKNYSFKDFREILSFISSSARIFYLAAAEKLNNKL